MEITSATPVGEIAAAIPSTIPVLERLSIDYCCGGKHTLAEACAEHNLGIGPLIKELEHQQQNVAPTETDWQTAPLAQLTSHIVRKHHAFARQQLEMIRGLAKKVERRHGGSHPELFQVSTAIESIAAELMHHFLREEEILFPYIAQLGPDKDPAPSPMFSSIEQQVSHMMTDHDHTGDELRLLREITRDYLPPADACESFCALYRALEDLEVDLRQHIHLENNVLFPRALAALREQS